MLMRSILATSDLGEDADLALATAAVLATGTGAELHAFHCVPEPVFPFWEGIVDDSTRERWLESARLDLEWQVRRVLGEETRLASLEVRIGAPAREINAAASAVAADLVVLGPHRPRTALDDLLGTTADRVVRTSAVPCLIANQQSRQPLRRVLIPTDFSDPARRALAIGVDWLVALGRAADDPSPMLVEILFVSAFASPSARPFAVEPRLAEQARAAQERLPDGARIRVLPRILSAPMPVDGIRRAAEQADTDLIILGTHGYGTLGRALIGSVASAVARTVAFPILLVPPAE
jgi:nucleotide-binding universal stress UspA family protein